MLILIYTKKDIKMQNTINNMLLCISNTTTVDIDLLLDDKNFVNFFTKTLSENDFDGVVNKSVEYVNNNY